LLGVDFSFPLLHGVLLYHYVASVTKQLPSSKKWIVLHLAPTLATFCYLVPFLFLPAEQKIAIFKNGGKEYLLFQQVLLLAVCFSGIVYVLWCTFLLSIHKKKIKNQFSDIEEINLQWLLFLVGGLGLVWALVIFTQNNSVIFLGVSLFVIFIGFFGVQQKDIFIKTGAVVSASPAKEVVKEKYTKSGLSEEKESLYYAKLEALIIEEKVYTNPEISLNLLASKLEIHPNYLSQVINHKTGKTFYDYINTFRVEEFKRLVILPENQQFTFISLAYTCGFNSKSTFNRYFKKTVQVTPSQYVKSIKR
jgi:AraC-like DNA-binding protein